MITDVRQPLNFFTQDNNNTIYAIKINDNLKEYYCYRLNAEKTLQGLTLEEFDKSPKSAEALTGKPLFKGKLKAFQWRDPKSDSLMNCAVYQSYRLPSLESLCRPKDYIYYVSLLDTVYDVLGDLISNN